VAFVNARDCNAGIENGYVDGVSLTHGPPGNRSHILTFAAAYADGKVRPQYPAQNCPCSNTNAVMVAWSHSPLDYVGQNYFCDSERQYTAKDRYVRDESDTLWDGEGCGPTSSRL